MLVELSLNAEQVAYLIADLQNPGEQVWVIYDFDERKIIGPVYDNCFDAVRDADELHNVVVRPFLTGGPAKTEDDE